MIERLNAHEDHLIRHFEAHPLFNCLPFLSWDDLLAVLIQRRFFSLSIVNVYEYVIDALQSHDYKLTVRSILNEEFPRSSKGNPLPTHREMLFYDLLSLGASREQILETPESSLTRSLRADTFSILTSCLDFDHPQLCLLSFLRFWGEVLVSVEYSMLWKRISERLSHRARPDRIKSRFYYYHMIHDRRQTDVSDEGLLGGLTHSQELAVHIGRLVSSQSALVEAMRLEQEAVNIKFQFYDQFASFFSTQDG
jgi:hypothetical protein